jgi:hypothetical protein
MSNNVKSQKMLATRSPQAAREVRRDSGLRQARTCYDHLAGVAGVTLLDQMLKRKWFQEEEGDARTFYRLTADGEQSLLRLGVDVPWAAAQRRPFAYGCLDWTERRFHLRGALSAAILEALTASKTVVRKAGIRSVVLEHNIAEWLES